MILHKDIWNVENANILVIGDVMLDVYHHGTVNRISPEAPVPVVQVTDRGTIAAGGAGNVMMNLAALGCKVTGIGCVGKDKEANQLKQLLQDAGVDAQFADGPLPTITKTRVLADKQHIVRYDLDTDFSGYSYDAMPNIILQISQRKTPFDAVIVADYNKGTLSYNIMDLIKETFSCPIIGDIKPDCKDNFKGIACIAPNLSEANKMIGHAGEYPAEVSRRLKEKMNVDVVIVTLSDRGLCVLDENNNFHSFEATETAHDPRQRFDVTGAGDTVISVYAACKCVGMSTAVAAYVANVAAGVVVNKTGTATCDRTELIDELKEDKRHGRAITSIQQSP